MENKPADEVTTPDPMAAWREMRDASMKAWSKAMIEAVNTDAYAQASGTMLETFMTNSAPLRMAFEKLMEKTLEQCSMPSRKEFLSLASQLTNVEMRLDDMDAKLERVDKFLSKLEDNLRAQTAGLQEVGSHIRSLKQQLSDSESRQSTLAEARLNEMAAKLEQTLAKAEGHLLAQAESRLHETSARLEQVEQDAPASATASRNTEAKQGGAEAVPQKKHRKVEN